MNVYKIVFNDGSSITEYGDSIQDVREFLVRSYGSLEVLTITLVESN